MSGAAHSNSEQPWWATCRPHLEWVNWAPGLDYDAYIAELMARAEAIHSDTLVYPYESGGYLLYPGTWAPPYEHLGGYDLLGKLREAARAHGLRFVVCFLGVSANTYATLEHPEWVQVDPAGKPIPKWPGYHFRSLCPNSEYSAYLRNIARDILGRYKPDGLYMEGVYLAPGYCYCPACTKCYQEAVGRPMPEMQDPNDRALQAFRQASCLKPFQKLREAIDDVHPDCAFFTTFATTYHLRQASLNAANIAQLADVVAIEAQWNYDLGGYDPSWAPRLEETGLIIECMKARSRKPVLGTVWIAKHVDQSYAPRSAANVILNFQEQVIHGAIPQTHTQNALEVDARHLATLGELYRDYEKAAEFLAASHTLAHAGLVLWADPNDPAHVYPDALRGWHKALIEAHIPWRVLTWDDIAAGRAGDCPVWIIPDAAAISDEAAAAVANSVERGQGLVMTGRTPWAQPVLAELAGIRPLENADVLPPEGFPLHTYYRVVDEAAPWDKLSGVLRSFEGRPRPIACAQDAKVAAWTLGLDPSRKSGRHILDVAYPGKHEFPLVMRRACGRGRVVYVAAELGAAAARFGDPQTLEVLSQTVRWTGETPPFIQTDAPPSVEIALHQNNRGTIVFLLNATTNVYLADPVRYVVPLSDVTVRLSGKAWAACKVRALSGLEVGREPRADSLTLKLPRIGAYEALFIEKEN